MSYEESQHKFPPKPGGQFYTVDKGNSLDSSLLYSPEHFSGSSFMRSPKLPTYRAQQRSLSAKNERSPSVFAISPNSSSHDVQNPPSLENVSAQPQCNRSHSVDNDNNVTPPSQQNPDTSYINLTWWTTKFSNEGFPLNPSNMDALTAPAMPNQQPPLPTAAGPMHLTTRMHKVTPYHNAFSRLSPLQPKSHNNPVGIKTDTVVPFSPKTSTGDTLKSITSKENRFKRTAEALHKSGLWDIAMKTGHLIKRNQELQKDLEQFKMDALNFLKSVIKNPENRDFIKSVLNSALCAGAGAAEGKKSVMTVVVSAAAAVAAVSVSDPAVSSNSVNNECGHNSTIDSGKSLSKVISEEAGCGISKDKLFSDSRTICD